IGAEEPVRAVEGYGDNLDTHRFDHCANLGGAREQRPAELRVWQVVAGKPEVVQPLVALIESEDHLPSRDTLELAQTRGRVLPVMNGERRERSIEALIGERERLGNCLHYRRGIDGPLIDLDRRWFDRDYLAIDGFVGARTPSNVHHGVGVTERTFDLSRDARIRHAVACVDLPDRIVAMGHQRSIARGRKTWHSKEAARSDHEGEARHRFLSRDGLSSS